MKWLSAIGLICQFVAFWFAAPELLGQSALERMQHGIRKLVTWIPIIITLIVILGYGITFIGISGYNAYQMYKNDKVVIDISRYFVYMGIFTSLYMIFMFRYKKIQKYLETKVAIPLTDRLLSSNETRKNALIIGAILFTLGFIIQLALVLVG